MINIDTNIIKIKQTWLRGRSVVCAGFFSFIGAVRTVTNLIADVCTKCVARITRFIRVSAVQAHRDEGRGATHDGDDEE